MMAEVVLLLGCAPSVARGAANLALADLPLQRGDRVLAVGELNDSGAFCPHMVEVENDRIPLTAVDAPRRLEICKEEEHVPLA